VWSGKHSIDIVNNPNGKSFKLINLPFYMIAALPYILAKLLFIDEEINI
jgi:hypothetical protein